MVNGKKNYRQLPTGEVQATILYGNLGVSSKMPFADTVRELLDLCKPEDSTIVRLRWRVTVKNGITRLDLISSFAVCVAVERALYALINEPIGRAELFALVIPIIEARSVRGSVWHRPVEDDAMDAEIIN